MRPYAETPIGHVREGLIMAARTIRSAVARFVVVTGLAASLIAGSYALFQPTDASAAKSTSACDDPGYYLNTSDAYLRIAAYYAGILRWDMVAYYYNEAEKY